MIVLGILIIMITTLIIVIMCVGYMGDGHGEILIGQIIVLLIGLSLSSWCFGYSPFWYLPKLIW